MLQGELVHADIEMNSIESFVAMHKGTIKCPACDKTPCSCKVLTVFADGGCSNNGTPDAKGYASVLIIGARRTLERIDLPNAQTNNQAELGALWAALDLLGTLLLFPQFVWTVELNMDSNFALNTVFNDWKIKAKYPVLRALRDDCQALLAKLIDADIHINPVKAKRDLVVQQLGH